MALKNLAAKTKEPLKATACGEDFQFIELSTKDENMVRKDGKTEFAARKDKLDISEDEFLAQYVVFRQVSGAESLTLDEFMGMGSIYIAEVSMAMADVVRALHPEYFKRVMEMEDKRQKEYMKVINDLSKKDAKKPE